MSWCRTPGRIYRSGDIDVFPLSIVREPTTDDCKPQGTKITLDPCPRERCVEFDRKRSVGRKELRHPPSSNMRGSRRPKIWKDSDEQIVRTTPRYDSEHAPDGIAHDKDSLNSIQ
jgi:hypothetical protein